MANAAAEILPASQSRAWKVFTANQTRSALATIQSTKTSKQTAATFRNARTSPIATIKKFVKTTNANRLNAQVVHTARTETSHMSAERMSASRLNARSTTTVKTRDAKSLLTLKIFLKIMGFGVVGRTNLYHHTKTHLRNPSFPSLEKTYISISYGP
jgi:hypothetical protein